MRQGNPAWEVCRKLGCMHLFVVCACMSTGVPHTSPTQRSFAPKLEGSGHSTGLQVEKPVSLFGSGGRDQSRQSGGGGGEEMYGRHPDDAG